MSRKPYPTDLTDAQWEVLQPLLPAAKPGGRPREVDLREVLNAIFYLLRSGCSWRLLPHEFPPWGTVHYYYWVWRHDGVWPTLHDAVRGQVRAAAGREVSPSAAILDSQSVKTTEKGGERGYDAGKKVKGRKRHLVVDTCGWILALVVHAADFQDRDGAWLVLARLRGKFPRLQLIWADGGYAGRLVQATQRLFGWLLAIVERSPAAQGFEVQPHRWIVERTFAWLGRYRRLSKDYEADTQSSEAMIYLAMIHLMVRRLKPT